MTKKFGLSKSKVSAFEQCPKRLWLQTHMRDEATIDEAAEARFAIGNAVGDLACSLLPEGVMVEAEPNLTAAIDATASLLAAGHSEPIFEATFSHDGVLIRADVMEHRVRTAGMWPRSKAAQV